MVDALDAWHRQIADESNLTLDGDSRQAATWLVAGRCIGLARAVLALLEAGFTAEAAAEVRVLHEATRLLWVLADEDEPELLRRWLADEDNRWVRPWEARIAGDRQRERVAERLPDALKEAEAHGDTESAAQLAEAIRTARLDEDGVLAANSLQIYDVLSRIGHIRRSSMRDSLSTALRQMATGPHPDPLVRAEYVEWVSHIIEEVVLAVCDALGPFFPGGSAITLMRKLVGALDLARAEAPLDAVTRASIARR